MRVVVVVVAIGGCGCRRGVALPRWPATVDRSMETFLAGIGRVRPVEVVRLPECRVAV